MIDEKNVVLQIFGCLLQNPIILSQTDKYFLTADDFSTSFEKKIFASIYNLYENGAKRLGVVDIDNYLRTSPASYQLWQREKGIEYLQDAEDLADAGNFDFYYKRLKAINAIKSLRRMGFDTSEFYEPNPINPKALEINEKFNELTAADIFDIIKGKVSRLEKASGIGSNNKVVKANSNIDSLLEKLQMAPDTGGRLQGKYFNTIVRGARRGKFYIRSASSGVGKTRTMVGDACYLAYPIRYDTYGKQWEWAGANEKVLIIVTEQDDEEVKTMILSYLTGINEEVILYGQWNDEQAKLLSQAREIMDFYKDNLIICQMPAPNIGQVQYEIRDSVLTNKVDYVFFDYIQSTPALLNEFRDLKVREDVVLGMLSAALKDLAVELGIFIMSATQTNAKSEDNDRAIKNESVVRGARSIVDKADMACVMSRPNAEELNIIEPLCPSGIIPNVVTDIYKMRRGRYTQVRIWSWSDLGTCRREDLFVTTATLTPVEINNLKQEYEDGGWEIMENVKKLNEEGGHIVGEVKIREIEEDISGHLEKQTELFYGLL